MRERFLERLKLLQESANAEHAQVRVEVALHNQRVILGRLGPGIERFGLRDFNQEQRVVCHDLMTHSIDEDPRQLKLDKANQARQLWWGNF